jgi:hypothetical protein
MKKPIILEIALNENRSNHSPKENPVVVFRVTRFFQGENNVLKREDKER